MRVPLINLIGLILMTIVGNRAQSDLPLLYLLGIISDSPSSPPPPPATTITTTYNSPPPFSWKNSLSLTTDQPNDSSTRLSLPTLKDDPNCYASLTSLAEPMMNHLDELFKVGNQDYDVEYEVEKKNPDEFTLSTDGRDISPLRLLWPPEDEDRSHLIMNHVLNWMSPKLKRILSSGKRWDRTSRAFMEFSMTLHRYSDLSRAYNQTYLNSINMTLPKSRLKNQTPHPPTIFLTQRTPNLMKFNLYQVYNELVILISILEKFKMDNPVVFRRFLIDNGIRVDPDGKLIKCTKTDDPIIRLICPAPRLINEALNRQQFRKAGRRLFNFVHGLMDYLLFETELITVSNNQNNSPITTNHHHLPTTSAPTNPSESTGDTVGSPSYSEKTHEIDSSFTSPPVTYQRLIPHDTDPNTSVISPSPNLPPSFPLDTIPGTQIDHDSNRDTVRSEFENAERKPNNNEDDERYSSNPTTTQPHTNSSKLPQNPPSDLPQPSHDTPQLDHHQFINESSVNSPKAKVNVFDPTKVNHNDTNTDDPKLGHHKKEGDMTDDDEGGDSTNPSTDSKPQHGGLDDHESDPQPNKIDTHFSQGKPKSNRDNHDGDFESDQDKLDPRRGFTDGDINESDKSKMNSDPSQGDFKPNQDDPDTSKEELAKKRSEPNPNKAQSDESSDQLNPSKDEFDKNQRESNTSKDEPDSNQKKLDTDTKSTDTKTDTTNTNHKEPGPHQDDPQHSEDNSDPHQNKPDPNPNDPNENDSNSSQENHPQVHVSSEDIPSSPSTDHHPTDDHQEDSNYDDDDEDTDDGGTNLLDDIKELGKDALKGLLFLGGGILGGAAGVGAGAGAGGAGAGGAGAGGLGAGGMGGGNPSGPGQNFNPRELYPDRIQKPSRPEPHDKPNKPPRRKKPDRDDPEEPDLDSLEDLLDSLGDDDDESNDVKPKSPPNKGVPHQGAGTVFTTNTVDKFSPNGNLMRMGGMMMNLPMGYPTNDPRLYPMPYPSYHPMTYPITYPPPHGLAPPYPSSPPPHGLAPPFLFPPHLSLTPSQPHSHPGCPPPSSHLLTLTHRLNFLHPIKSPALLLDHLPILLSLLLTNSTLPPTLNTHSTLPFSSSSTLFTPGTLLLLRPHPPFSPHPTIVVVTSHHQIPTLNLICTLHYNEKRGGLVSKMVDPQWISKALQ